MIPQSQQRKKKNSAKVNLILSVIFHAAIGGGLLYLAAISGALGKKIQHTVQVTMEKKEEKPKEPEKPKAEPPKQEVPKTVETAKVDVPRPSFVAPPPAAVDNSQPNVAPPAAEVAAFDFDGGRTVVSSKDPVELYKGLLEFSIRSHWDRPEDLQDKDSDFKAQITVTVDSTGKISDPVWKTHSANKVWDESVLRAVVATPSVSQPPPKNFPSRIDVQFDVVDTAAINPLN